ncbi:hypothetical protein EVAR_68302_1 [Eumeta japonica]|uniref:Uncharacterized protein n=1 Tax=Eumeta variegata TaxID=151549 RepID=A0A4C1STV2_EUMVA|nr:hypothetical protein EVAR_68302_1 [Eumeta japonica]
MGGSIWKQVSEHLCPSVEFRITSPSRFHVEGLCERERDGRCLSVPFRSGERNDLHTWSAHKHNNKAEAENRSFQSLYVEIQQTDPSMHNGYAANRVFIYVDSICHGELESADFKLERPVSEYSQAWTTHRGTREPFFAPIISVTKRTHVTPTSPPPAFCPPRTTTATRPPPRPASARKGAAQ